MDTAGCAETRMGVDTGWSGCRNLLRWDDEIYGSLLIYRADYD